VTERFFTAESAEVTEESGEGEEDNVAEEDEVVDVVGEDCEAEAWKRRGAVGKEACSWSSFTQRSNDRALVSRCLSSASPR
jgi:hypothetical protein